MISISSEEKNLKRFLKRKVEINLNTVVKFLICGMACFTITACGGGGGGGSSAVQVRKENMYSKLPQTESKKTINVDSGNKVGIVEVGKVLTNNGDISIDSNKNKEVAVSTNKEILNELPKTLSNGVGIYMADGLVKNDSNVKISLSGNKIGGIVVKNAGVDNAGTIVAKNATDVTGIYGIYNENSGDQVFENRQDGKIELDGNNVVGMAIDKGDANLENFSVDPKLKRPKVNTTLSADINNSLLNANNAGTISVNSGDTSTAMDKENLGGVKTLDLKAIGILAKGNLISLTNNGTIAGKGQHVAGVVLSGERLNFNNNGSVLVSAVIDGNMGSTDEDDDYIAESAGVYSEGNYLGIQNNGVVSVNITEGKNESTVLGIEAVGEGNRIINKNKIDLKDSKSSTEMVAVGMISKGNSDGYIENSGDIHVIANESSGIVSNALWHNDTKKEDPAKAIIKNTGTISMEGIAVDGIYVSNAKTVENSGKISIISRDIPKNLKNDQENYDLQSSGINTEGNNVIIENTKNGQIVMSISGKNSDYRAIGLGTYGDNNKIVNNGLVKINSESDMIGDIAGLDFWSKDSLNGTVENNGKIDIASIDGIGIIAANSDDQNSDKFGKGTGTVINNGDISLKGMVSKYYNENIGIYATLANKIENNGNIFVKGNKTTGIGATGENITIKNSKNIELNNNFVTPPNRENNENKVPEVSGIYGKVNKTQIKNLKDGNINLNVSGGNTDQEAVGIGAEGNKNILSNEGTININLLEGNGVKVTGILAKGNENKISNSGMINFSGKVHVTSDDVRADSFTGMYITGENTIGTNEEKGTINITYTIDKQGDYSGDSPKHSKTDALYATNGGLAINKGKIAGGGKSTGILVDEKGIGENKGVIELTSIKIDGTIREDISQNSEITSPEGFYTREYGMVAEDENGNSRITNNGKISITGSGNAMEVIKRNIAVNNKEIILKSLPIKNIAEYRDDDEVLHKVNIDSMTDDLVGILGKDSEITNETTGIISIEGFGTAMEGLGDSNRVTNRGIIEIREQPFEVKGTEEEKKELTGYDKSFGVHTENGEGINYGTIKVDGELVAAMSVYREDIHRENENINILNEGTIINSGSSRGMLVNGGATGYNRKTIITSGNGSAGMYALKGEVINEANGTITVSGDSAGMFADEYSTALNKGTINVTDGAIGMLAVGKEAQAINSETGVIKVTNSGKNGMRAEKGGSIKNNGTIYIDKDYPFNGTDPKNIAISADGHSSILNEGTIISSEPVTVSNIQVTPNSTLSAKEITVNGSVTVLADDAKAGYAEEYSAENVIKGDKIEVGENANIKSNSLMYTAVPVVTNRTLGARLVRTGVADKLDSRFTDVGKALDRAYADAGKLDKSQKAVADKIFDHSGNRADLNSAVAKASGKEYVAVARQVFDIKDSFRKYDSTVINSLGDNDFNATVIGDYSKVDTKDSIANYKDTMTGFNAVAKLPHNMYGVAGYGFSNIDYKDSSSKEKIHTLHAALYKDFVKENNKLTLGVFGDYNFHRMNRESLDSNVKTNFHSYLVGVSGEFAKHYGDKFYVEPMVGLDLTYGNINRVSEDSVLEVSKHDYTSVLPKVGVTVGERFDMADLYVKAQYSKDLGNMDKDLKVKLLNQDATIENENLKAGQFDVSVGVKSEINSVTLSADVGRRFGKTHTTYVKAGIGYRF